MGRRGFVFIDFTEHLPYKGIDIAKETDFWKNVLCIGGGDCIRLKRKILKKQSKKAAIPAFIDTVLKQRRL